jgi:RNA polymerase sigma factor (sigma-70 family)
MGATEELELRLVQLVERQRPRIARLFARYRIPSWDREDLLQEALVVMIGKWETIGSKEGYLLGILRFKCFGYLRQRYHLAQTAADVSVLETLPEKGSPPQERRELLVDLQSLAVALPFRQRRALFLRYRLGMSVKEAAEVHPRFARKTVEKDVFKAVARLKELVNEKGSCG